MLKFRERPNGKPCIWKEAEKMTPAPSFAYVRLFVLSTFDCELSLKMLPTEIH
jgi:hypothetical protein